MINVAVLFHISFGILENSIYSTIEDDNNYKEDTDKEIIV